MTVLAFLVALYAALLVFVPAAFALGASADLRAQHELQSLIGRDGKGERSVHTQLDTQNGERNHD